MNARGEARVGLVVAHCHEEMRWLAQVHRGLHEGAGSMPLRLELYIYEKVGRLEHRTLSPPDSPPPP